jgi:hypothetical protein
MPYDTITKTFNGIAAVQMQCWCGVAFGIPKSLYDHYQVANDRKAQSYSLYCPLGHEMVPVKTDAQKLREELARTKATLDQRDERITELRESVERQTRRINGYKGVTTRLKRRIQAGRCPCCSHEFKDLGRHMKNQHPSWNPDAHAEALAGKAE